MNHIDDIYDSVENELKNNFYNFDNVFNKLKNENYDEEDLNLIFYDFNQIYNNDSKTFESREKRINQDKFREKIIKRDKCCILSNSHPDMCEACHIIPYSESNEEQKYDINNGILLERGLHSLFDKYLWSINRESYVIISEKILNNPQYNLINIYNKIKLQLNEKQLDYLKNHYEQFIKN